MLVVSVKKFELVESQKYFPKLVESQKYFSAQKFGSFKLRIFNIVAVRFFLAHFSCRNFLATMPRRDPFGAIRQPFNYSSGADDGLDFIRFVGGR